MVSVNGSYGTLSHQNVRTILTQKLIERISMINTRPCNRDGPNWVESGFILYYDYKVPKAL